MTYEIGSYDHGYDDAAEAADYFTDADCIPEPFDADVPDFDPYDEGWYTDEDLDNDEREIDPANMTWDDGDILTLEVL